MRENVLISSLKAQNEKIPICAVAARNAADIFFYLETLRWA
jgi:hypothetical protein